LALGFRGYSHYPVFDLFNITVLIWNWYAAESDFLSKVQLTSSAKYYNSDYRVLFPAGKAAGI
jgi:hypothetical protein